MLVEAKINSGMNSTLFSQGKDSGFQLTRVLIKPGRKCFRSSPLECLVPHSSVGALSQFSLVFRSCASFCVPQNSLCQACGITGLFPVWLQGKQVEVYIAF